MLLLVKTSYYYSLMKTKQVFLLVFLSLGSYGQDTLIDSKLCIKTAPLALLDIYSGMSPRIGIEYKIKNTISFYNELGTYVPNANSWINNHGFLTKFEIKLYLNKERKTSGQYLSTEFFFKHQSYKSTYDTIINSNREKYRKDYLISKNVGCCTLKYGILVCHKNRLILDFFFGLGFRYRATRNSLLNDERIQPQGSYSENVSLSSAGNFKILNLDAGLKIGYGIR